jgi:hypothetical protein
MHIEEMKKELKIELGEKLPNFLEYHAHMYQESKRRL